MIKLFHLKCIRYSKQSAAKITNLELYSTFFLQAVVNTFTVFWIVFLLLFALGKPYFLNSSIIFLPSSTFDKGC